MSRHRIERDLARAEVAELKRVLVLAYFALEHCRQRPHEHNPAADWQGPTRCEVIDRAQAAIRGSK